MNLCKGNMEYLMMKGRNIGLVACVWLAVATRLTVMATSGQCFDWKGNPVSPGTRYIPEDPCMKCKCQNGFPIMCHAVTCHPPNINCAKWKKTEGECCTYDVCLDPPGLNPDLPGQDNSTIGDGSTADDDSITNLGLRLVASTVTSFLVLALLLFMVHRLRQRRLLLAMRRFEAQARRQQLEESESDQYIPDTYLGMIECPPYEDPPPPYTSPKPHPRILPGEAPPPYEEVDQNRNSNNNNCINLITNQRDDNQTQRGESQEQGQGHQREEGEGPPAIVRRSLGRTENVEHDQRQISSSGTSTGRLRSESSPQRSSNGDSKDHESCQCDPICGVSSETSHNSSLGRVSNSTDSTESHNCSCDSEQTLLKKTVANNKMSSRTSQTLPPGFCLGQDRSKGRKVKQHNSNSKTSQSCHGHLNPGADLSWSPANSSQSLPPEPNTGITSQKYSSLPPKFKNVNEGQRTDSAPVVTAHDPTLSQTSDGAVGFHHPLAEELSESASSVPANPSGNASMSQSCVILRDTKHNHADQEQLRKSLPPLDFSVNIGQNAECESTSQGDAAEQASGTHNNSHEYLRNIRLSNLLNSPVTSFDSPVSPASPMAKPMQRSHSVTSDISVFSVCSETGEKRSSKQVGRALRNDSQYPDIPISAHAMRMAALAHQIDGQDHQHPDLEGHPAIDSATNDPLMNGKTSCDDNSRQCSDRVLKSKLNTVEEGSTESAAAGSDSRLEPQAESMHSAVKDTASPKGHRSRKKDKHKQNRHSTGSMMQCKPKKHTHSSGASNLPSNGDADRRVDYPLASSPSHSKKNPSEKPHASPSNKASASPSKSHVSKGDSSKKKAGKPVCDSYKQYGFIDDPGLLQSRNGIVELRLVNPEKTDTISPKVMRKSGTQTEKSVLGCENKQQGAICKLDRKRHLTSADKSSYSPSPTRQKSSRPRSFAHPTGPGEGSPILGQEASQSPNHSSPRRKLRNTARSKKRVSYPVTGPDSSPNMVGQSGDQDDQRMRENPVQEESANPDLCQSSHPLGLITVRNGPLSSYV